MNVLILGSGGREHAFGWKIAQSMLCSNLYFAPGNAGTKLVGTNIFLDMMDFDAVAAVVVEKKIDLLLVGPEAPLVEGIRDYFEVQPDFKKLLIIGPGQVGAQLEGSKEFAKAFMARHGIPTARYRAFTKEHIKEAKGFLKTMSPPYVLKADGLAAGKGVVILDKETDAAIELDEMLTKSKFGKASAKVVIEEFLKGIELSVFALTDGKHFVLLPEAKDYKRIGHGDTGLNTGGMGAVSPVPFADEAFMNKVIDRVVEPTIKGLAQEGIPYVGFVFFGLINVGGDPFVIEYNVRMGDPETEAVLPRIESDLLKLLAKAAQGELKNESIRIDEGSTVTVVLVSGGYPGEFSKGKQITVGEVVDDALIFHAGTIAKEGEVRSSGGRVIAVTGRGSDLQHAIDAAYKQADLINFQGKYVRRDIGYELKG